MNADKEFRDFQEAARKTENACDNAIDGLLGLLDDLRREDARRNRILLVGSMVIGVLLIFTLAALWIFG